MANGYTKAATDSLLAAKANLFSPNFSGKPAMPTPDLAQNDNTIATTAFVRGQKYAPLDTPAFTGNPTAPTHSPDDYTGAIATTAFVKSQNYAPLDSPALTGSPTSQSPNIGEKNTRIATTYYVEDRLAHSPILGDIPHAPTAGDGNNSDQIATTAFVQNAINSKISSGGGTTGSANFVSVLDYGAAGNGSTDDTAAINRALAAMGNGGVLLFPGGRNYVTSGNHTVPRRGFIEGSGSLITHTGNNTLFSFQQTSAFTLEPRGGARGLEIHGNNGANEVGFEVGNMFGFALRDCNIGNVAVGVIFKNNNNWTEGAVIDSVKVDNANAGLRFMRGGGTDSFGYTRVRNFYVNVNAGGAAIDFGSTNAGSPSIYVYNSDFDVTAWLNGSGACAVRVGPNANVNPNRVFIVGETGQSNTSTINNQGGQFIGMGYANVAAASSRFSGTGTTQVS
jgi:hypothetical protein